MSPWILSIVLITLLQKVACQRYLIVTPSKIQPGVDHIVVVAVYNVGGSTIPVTIIAELEDGSQLFEAPLIAVDESGAVKNVIRVPEETISSLQTIPQYVFVRAMASHSSLSFDTRKRVELSMKTLSVFVQTNKPIYLRQDKVHLRIVIVNSNLVPNDTSKVVIDIKNPHNLIVQRFELDIASRREIRRHTIRLGPRPIQGQWTVTAKYGIQEVLSSDYHFEVQDYVLPRFNVEIEPPLHVTPQDERIQFRIKARYTYDKGVQGDLTLRLGIWNDDTGNVTEFYKNVFTLSPDEDGVKELSVSNRGYGAIQLGRRLWIYASVMERASGKRQNATDTSVVLSESNYNIECDTLNPTYKTGLPVIGRVRVTHQSGNPAEDMEVTVRISGNAQVQEIQTGEEGYALYNFPATSSTSQLTVLVRVAEERVETACILNPIQTPCSSSNTISIKPPSAERLTHGWTTFEILKQSSNSRRIDVTVIVLARGLIQTSNTIPIQGTFSSFRLFIDKKWSNKFHVLAYYLDPSCDSVIADGVTLYTADAFNNDIAIQPSHEIVEPGGQVKLVISAKPHSDVALLAVDAGLYVLNNRNKLTRTQVFEELEEFDMTCSVSTFTSVGIFQAYGVSALTNSQFSTADRVAGAECSTRSGRSAEADTDTQCCKDVGLTIRNRILTDVAEVRDSDLTRLTEQCNKELQKAIEGTSKDIDVLWSCSREKWCLQAFMASCVPAELRERASTLQGSNIIPGQIVVQRRSYFPHAWLVDEKISTGAKGSVIIDVNIPDSITQWVLHGMALSKEGFGVAAPLSLRAFKPIFVECHVPFSIRRQEQVSIACTAYNYGPATTAMMRVVETPQSVCTKAGIGKSSPLVRFNMEEKSTETILIPLIPLNVGIINVTVELITSIGMSDRVVVAIRVEEEGTPHETSFSAEIDPAGVNLYNGATCPLPNLQPIAYRDCCYTVVENGMCKSCLPNLSTKDECCNLQTNANTMAWGHFCEMCPNTQEYRPSYRLQQNYFRLTLPENSVPGTAKAFVSVSGRYLQGTMSIETDVIVQLRSASGCGEQNMANFAPNVAIMKYMRGKGYLSENEKATLTEKVSDTYQHQLQYRTSDGGFAIYSTEPTATWLTGYVLKCICAATDVVHVEESIFNGIFGSLQARQHSTGEFYERGKRISHVLGNNNALTAYIVIGLLECCGQEDYPFSQETANAVCQAVNFMENQVTNNVLVSEHTKAMVFYALSLACVRCKVCNCSDHILPNLQQLMCSSIIIKNGMSFWAGDSRASEPPLRTAIETTSYMLCAYIARSETEKARPLAKWLNTARGSTGLFRTTHDTSLGLKCLGDFALLADTPKSMEVNVSDVGNTFNRQMRIDMHNLDVQHQIEVSPDSVVKVTSAGSGMGLIQVHLSYKKPDTETHKCPFYWNVTAKSFISNRSFQDKKGILIRSCTRYLKRGFLDTAMMEVEIPTGYEACEDDEGDPYCLKQIYEAPNRVFRLDMYEVTGRSVILYIDKIYSDRTICLTFKATQKFPVDHVAPVTARVYSFYEPDEQCTVFYTPDNSSPALALLGCDSKPKKDTPICLCGAGHCPKLEEISNRLCNVCFHHHYAYKVQVKKIMTQNTWLKIRCQVEEVLKDGHRQVSVGNRILFWTQEVCRLSAPLVEGEYYHIMGIDGPRFVLDHHSHIEPWLQVVRKQKCTDEAREACFRKRCKGKRGKQRKSCITRVIKKCEQTADKECISSFALYLERIRNNKICEKAELCN